MKKLAINAVVVDPVLREFAGFSGVSLFAKLRELLGDLLHGTQGGGIARFLLRWCRCAVFAVPVFAAAGHADPPYELTRSISIDDLRDDSSALASFVEDQVAYLEENLHVLDESCGSNKSSNECVEIRAARFEYMTVLASEALGSFIRLSDEVGKLQNNVTRVERER